MVADLHLGKAESFQVQGIPIRVMAMLEPNPLLALCHHWNPTRLVILGDLIHSRLGLTQHLRDVLRALPDLIDAEVDWIGGNHDRSSVIEGLPQQRSQRLGRLWLSHEPERPPQDDGVLLNICGHVHPMGRIHAEVISCLPCFAFQPDHDRLIIPALGS